MTITPPVRDISAIVFDGDVINSRSQPSTLDWLDELCAEWNEALAADIAADFKRTKGDEVQGLLRPVADPLAVWLRYALAPDALPMRWALVAGPVFEHAGPATDGDGPAYIRASSLLEQMRHSGELLRLETGVAALDDRLALFSPWLGDWAASLTAKQRAILRIHLLASPAPSSRAQIAQITQVDPSAVTRTLNSPTNRRMLGLLDILRADIRTAQDGLLIS